MKKDMITKENYEIYIIDYLDGTLPISFIKEMDIFLLQHPDLKEKIDDLNQTKLIPPEIKFSGKQRLMKEEYDECPDYYAIAATEKTLTEIDRITLGNKIYNTDFIKLISIYSKLKFTADTNIRFEKKKSLYRKNIYLASFYKWTTIAAIILLFLGTGLIIYYPLEKSGLSKGSKKYAPEPFLMSAPISQHPASSALTSDIENELAEVYALLHYSERPPIRSEEWNNIPEIIPLQQAITVDCHEYIVPPEEIIQKYDVSANIILSKNAVDWKPSNEIYIPENILTSIIHVGKNLADKIKNKSWEF